MNPRFLENWKKVRAKGIRRYVVVYGILGWGIPMFIGAALFIHRGPLTVMDALVLGMLCSLGGGFFGAATWRQHEREFLRATASENA
jgi:hypothetical protein